MATVPQLEVVPPRKSLATKLAEACDKVSGIEKKGRNDQQKYSYVKAADVAKAIRHELYSRGVVIITNELELLSERMQTNSGGWMTEIRLKTEYVVTDGHEELRFSGYGVARDSGDKAVYKAKTGALKYFLRGLGLIPDEKDDPEADASVDSADNEVAFDLEQKMQNQAAVAEYQIRAFYAACTNKGRTHEQIKQYLKYKFHIDDISELQRQDFTEAIKWALGREEPIQTLKTSVKAAKRKLEPVVEEIPNYEVSQ